CRADRTAARRGAAVRSALHPHADRSRGACRKNADRNASHNSIREEAHTQIEAPLTDKKWGGNEPAPHRSEGRTTAQEASPWLAGSPPAAGSPGTSSRSRRTQTAPTADPLYPCSSRPDSAEDCQRRCYDPAR